MTPYKKSVDQNGNITSLIFQEGDDKIIVMQPVNSVSNPSGYAVSVVQVRSNDELKAQIGGNLSECDPEEYNETLFNKWGFDGSSIYRASVPVPETKGEPHGDNLQSNPGTPKVEQGQQQSTATPANENGSNPIGSEHETDANAGTDIPADATAQGEGQSGSVNDADEQSSNTDAGNQQGSESVGEGSGTLGDEPHSDIGGNTGNSEPANDGDGSIATAEGEKSD